MRQLILLIGIAFLFSGCMKLINPYESDFNCPKTVAGKCQPVEKSYEDALRYNNTNKSNDSNSENDMSSENNSNSESDMSNKSMFTEKCEYVKKCEDNMDGDFIFDSKPIEKCEYVKKCEEEVFDNHKKDSEDSSNENIKKPVRHPGKVIRILLFDYVDENGILYGKRYIYVEVQPPKWDLTLRQ